MRKWKREWKDMKRHFACNPAFIHHLSFVHATVFRFAGSFWNLRALNNMFATMPFDRVWPHWKSWLMRGHSKFSESSTRPQGPQQAQHMELLRWLGHRNSVLDSRIYFYIVFWDGKIDIFLCFHCIVYCISTSIHFHILHLIVLFSSMMYFKCCKWNWMLSIRLSVDFWMTFSQLVVWLVTDGGAGPGPMPYCDMQTFRSVGEPHCPTNREWRESHRGNNEITYNPMTNAFLKTGFIFVEPFALRRPFPSWMTLASSKPMSPQWFWTLHALLEEPSSNPHSPSKAHPDISPAAFSSWNLQHKPSTPWVLVRQALWKLPVMMMWRWPWTPFQRLWGIMLGALGHETSLMISNR